MPALFTSTLRSFRLCFYFFFFFNHPATTEIYTLSLHDALPILRITRRIASWRAALSRTSFSGLMTSPACRRPCRRSEEHTSELQSLTNLVCRLLLEKKKKKKKNNQHKTKSRYNNNTATTTIATA